MLTLLSQPRQLDNVSRRLKLIQPDLERTVNTSHTPHTPHNPSLANSQRRQPSNCPVLSLQVMSHHTTSHYITTNHHYHASRSPPYQPLLAGSKCMSSFADAANCHPGLYLPSGAPNAPGVPRTWRPSAAVSRNAGPRSPLRTAQAWPRGQDAGRARANAHTDAS